MKAEVVMVTGKTPPAVCMSSELQRQQALGTCSQECRGEQACSPTPNSAAANNCELQREEHYLWVYSPKYTDHAPGENHISKNIVVAQIILSVLLFVKDHRARWVKKRSGKS